MNNIEVEDYQIKQSKQRVDYIDLLKGVTIMLVVWIHTDYPLWLSTDLVNITFFFLAGIFFRRKPFKEFLRSRFLTLLLPFLIFYLLSYPFRMVVHFWDHREIGTFFYGCIFDLFKSAARSDYLSVNVPLWFLLALFFIEIYQFFLSKLPKIVQFILALIFIYMRPLWEEIPTPLMMNNALEYLGYFMIGNIIGRDLIKILENKRNVIIGSIIFIILAILWVLAAYTDVLDNRKIWYPWFLTFIIIGGISFSSLFNLNRRCEIIRFFGKNSGAVLCMHLFFLIPASRMMHKFYPEGGASVGFVAALIALVFLYYAIKIVNKKIPWIIGKPVTDKKVDLIRENEYEIPSLSQKEKAIN